MKLDKADKVFSDYIRLRDGKCVRCGKLPKGERADGAYVVGLECSHFFGRRKESVRYDEDNAEALCHYCHRHLTEHPHEHREHKLKRLGQKRYDELVLRANKPQKRNRQAAYEKFKEKLEELNK